MFPLSPRKPASGSAPDARKTPNGQRPLHLALVVGLAILAIAQLVMLGVRGRAIGPAMAFLTSGDDVSEVSFHLADGTVARLGDGRRTLLLVFDPDCPHTRRVTPAWSEWLSAVDTGGLRILGIAPGPRAPADAYAREMEWDVPVAALEGLDDDTMEMIVGRVPWVIAIDERGIVVSEDHGSRLSEVAGALSARGDRLPGA